MIKIGLGNLVTSHKRNTPKTEVSFPKGLFGKRYIGYFNDDVNWFLTATPQGNTNFLNQINGFSSESDYYSWEWTGYFKPSTTEQYTFYTLSDDASYLWIGDNALSGYTTSNAIVNNGGLHGPTEQQGSINLNANQYYPIRIQFGEMEGGDIITVSFSTPTIPKRSDGLNYYFNNVV
jgi:hypothetical protein